MEGVLTNYFALSFLLMMARGEAEQITHKVL